MSGADRGFTLIEAVVALAILGSVGVATMEAVGAQVRGAERARDAYVLAALAQDRLVATHVIPAPGEYPLPDSLARGSFPEPFESYGWTASVTPLYDQPDVYHVQVEILGPRSRYDVATLVYQPRPAERRP